MRLASRGLPVLSLVSRVRVSGREHIPDGGYVAASNHPSNFDALFVALAIRRRIRFMGKSELFGGRWGRLLNRLGAFRSSAGCGTSRPSRPPRPCSDADG